MRTLRSKTTLRELNILVFSRLNDKDIQYINSKLNKDDILIFLTNQNLQDNFIELYPKININKYLILNTKILKQMYFTKEYDSNYYLWTSFCFYNGNQNLIINKGIPDSLQKWEDLESLDIFSAKEWQSTYNGRFGQIIYLNEEERFDKYSIGLPILKSNYIQKINTIGLGSRCILENSYENE